jgi:hypothetical protein
MLYQRQKGRDPELWMAFTGMVVQKEGQKYFSKKLDWVKKLCYLIPPPSCVPASTGQQVPGSKKGAMNFEGRCIREELGVHILQSEGRNHCRLIATIQLGSGFFVFGLMAARR